MHLSSFWKYENLIFFFFNFFSIAAPPQQPKIEYEGVQVPPGRNVTVDSKAVATVSCVSHYGNVEFLSIFNLNNTYPILFFWPTILTFFLNPQAIRLQNLSFF